MLRTRVLVLVGLFAAGFFCQSAASGFIAPADSAHVRPDTAQMTVRHPPDTLLARFRSTPAFNYKRTKRWTWWHDAQRWVQAQIARWVGKSSVGSVLEFVSYFFLALLVGYAAFMLVRLRSDAQVPGRRTPETLPHPQTPGEMQAIDFDARLEKAVDKQQYRRAVRLLYQHLLQRLDRTGAIAWRAGKTNRAYVNEVDADLRPAFETLTRLFERIWYGGATVDADHFRQVRAHFDSFWENVETEGVSQEDAFPTVLKSRDASTDRPSV